MRLAKKRKDGLDNQGLDHSLAWKSSIYHNAIASLKGKTKAPSLGKFYCRCITSFAHDNHTKMNETFARLCFLFSCNVQLHGDEQ